MPKQPEYGIYDPDRRGYLSARGLLTEHHILAVVFDEPEKARKFARKVGAPEDTMIVVMGA